LITFLSKGDSWKEQYKWVVEQREEKQRTLEIAIGLFNAGELKMVRLVFLINSCLNSFSLRLSLI
jgi:hypothetical protein